MQPLVDRLPPPVRESVRGALAVLVPVECCGCGGGDRPVCARCAAAFAPATRTTVIGDPALPAAYALDYAGPVRRALLALKESGRTDVARLLGPALRASILSAARAAGGRVELATVPSSRRAFRRRGYRPVPLLVRGAGLPPAGVLRPARQSRGQAGLGRAERSGNRDHALRAPPEWAGRRVLLVDDILTSGATLLEARRALEEAGARVLGAAVLARTPRR